LKCVREHCYSPVACGGFGYCRELNFLREQLNDKVTLHCGDCLVVLPTLAENSIDSCCTDPPYHLTAHKMTTPQPIQAAYNDGKGNPFCRPQARQGFMGKQWDGGDIAFRPELWREVYRVLKPGAHLLAFGGTRTFHRMACAIEDAGFEIRDCVMWIYGSGFPKSHDVSKGIDRAAGAEREIIGSYDVPGYARSNVEHGTQSRNKYRFDKTSNESATDAAREWEGWGTALKPACEPIVLARKPLSESTVAANVLKWGVGALNINECRVGTTKNVPASESTHDGIKGIYGEGIGPGSGNGSGFNPNIGRWPANVIHDGSEEVTAGFPDSVARPADGAVNGKGSGSGEFIQSGVYGAGRLSAARTGYRDAEQSAARFFYTAKADSDDRLGSKHPTVKPLDLMQYLVRLVTPKGGTTLDPFAGTGTTGEAAWREGMKAVLIERESEYQDDIRRRMELALAGPDTRAYQSAKARQGNKPSDYGPLFDML
jgi:site-specific DNA-methyltransferase (adenine-specific)